MEKVMFACGHVSNAVNSKGEPSCAICFGIQEGAETIVEAPNISKRKARCACGKTVKSDFNLPFFEFRGEGSPASTDYCKCGYHKVAHEKHKVPCRIFEAYGSHKYDEYYCGCRGWD